jgi:hypothetical protein
MSSTPGLSIIKLFTAVFLQMFVTIKGVLFKHFSAVIHIEVL